tara:strand:+ start:4979 stop:5788 length:810 start_codon:yes stop_codon:yes gene_type:complete
MKIKKITAKNPGLTTYQGTNTYIIGDKNLIIIDPGPYIETHLANIINYIADRKVDFIIFTHHHQDHVGLLNILQEATNSKILIGEKQKKFIKDIGINIRENIIFFKNQIAHKSLDIIPYHTPGHASDHYCFQLPNKAIFTGDHIMGWSTTMIRHPDGNMEKYIKSIKKIRDCCNEKLLPGHGEEVLDGVGRCDFLIRHRNIRREQIINALKNSELNLEQITNYVYNKINPALKKYAKYNVESSIVELINNKIIIERGIKKPVYRLVGKK